MQETTLSSFLEEGGSLQEIESVIQHAQHDHDDYDREFSCDQCVIRLQTLNLFLVRLCFFSVTHDRDFMSQFGGRKIIHNPPVPVMYEHALRHERGTTIVSGGALLALSGSKTGRSPKDKRVVDEASTSADVWWGECGRYIPNLPVYANLADLLPCFLSDLQVPSTSSCLRSPSWSTAAVLWTT